MQANSNTANNRKQEKRCDPRLQERRRSTEKDEHKGDTYITPAEGSISETVGKHTPASLCLSVIWWMCSRV